MSNFTIFSVYINGTAIFDELQFNETELRFYNFSQQVRFDNLNASSRIIRFYGLSNALIFNVNGSIYGSSTISSNDGNINTTLPSLNSSVILNEFNLTEGTTRSNSPMIISSAIETSNTKTYTIHSNISETLNETQVRFRKNLRACTDFQTAYLSSAVGYNKSYSVGDWSCDENYLTFTVDQLALGDNTFSFSMVNPGAGGGDGGSSNSQSDSHGGNETVQDEELPLQSSPVLEDLKDLTGASASWVKKNFLLILVVFVVALGVGAIKVKGRRK